jgi:hypothetical protein
MDRRTAYIQDGKEGARQLHGLMRCWYTTVRMDEKLGYSWQDG